MIQRSCYPPGCWSIPGAVLEESRRSCPKARTPKKPQERRKKGQLAVIARETYTTRLNTRRALLFFYHAESQIVNLESFLDHGPALVQRLCHIIHRNVVNESKIDGYVILFVPAPTLKSGFSPFSRSGLGDPMVIRPASLRWVHDDTTCRATSNASLGNMPLLATHVERVERRTTKILVS